MLPYAHTPTSTNTPSPDGSHFHLTRPMPLERFDTSFSNYSCTSTSQLVLDSGRSDGTERQQQRRAFDFWCWPSRSKRKQSPDAQSDLEKKTPEADKSGSPGRCAKHPWDGWRVIVLDSWLNVLLVLIPVSWILEFTLVGSSALIFIFCVLSMIPLVKLHDLATRELAIRIGGSRTGLLNASMSNIVELVFAISALRKCELRVVQSSLVGSILSKLLLVLGMCFFAGGLRFTEQGFDPTATHVQSSLLIISVSAVLLPCAYHFTIGRASEKIFDEQKVDLLRMSHGVSIILLLTYASYLLFQLYSHTHLYQDRLKKSMPHSRVVDLPKSSPSTVTLKDINEPQVLRKDTDTMYCCSVRSRRSFSLSNTGSTSDVDLTGEDSATVVGRDSDTIASRGAVRAPDVDPTVRLVQSYYADDRQTIVVLDEKADEKRIEHSDSRQSGVRGTNHTTADEDRPTDVEHSERTDKHPQLSWLMTLALLTAVTVMVSVNADQLVESMDGISTHISKTWIALILLPAVGSIAECVTAINTSVKDELTLSISVAVGSTVQTALFVIPFIVLLGWVLNKPLALLFDPFESVVLYISVHTMSSVVQDGKSNWLEGVILMCLYFIIAVSFWFYPGSDVSETLAICT